MMGTITLLQHVLVVFSGLLVGFILGLLGGGGSILAVPLLLYLVGYHYPHIVIGTTAVAVALTAYANLLTHWRAGTVRWKPALLFALPALVSFLLLLRFKLNSAWLILAGAAFGLARFWFLKG